LFARASSAHCAQYSSSEVTFDDAAAATTVART
jgi:hypothetical protein